MLKILQVIHGYPPRYNAGSEIYTQTLAHGLARQGHTVAVFTRKEDPQQPNYEMSLELDYNNPTIRLHTINLVNSRDSFSHDEVDKRFDDVLDEFNPDVVHVGHLNHLSTSVVQRAAKKGKPILFTLHDFWLMCPRGQFLQFNLGGDSRALCDGQEDRKCAVHCYSRYFTGLPSAEARDIEYWTAWVRDRMAHIREVVEHVNLFIAPSQYLRQRFVKEFGVRSDKITYLDYGFDRQRLNSRSRKKEGDFVFGYIGTHTTPKGIDVLIRAFAMVRGHARLRVWGRDNPQVTPALKEMGRNLPLLQRELLEWRGEYRNECILRDVLNNVDAIVVPSIWVENSPLVIHEAQQAGVPIITSNLGGMAEYVKHEVNGLLFRPGDVSDLSFQMQRFVDDPTFASRLGEYGYLKSPTGNVPSIDEHVRNVTSLYEQVLRRKVVVS